MYKVTGSVVVFLVLYIDDILLMVNDVSVLSSVKIWLSNNFSKKDLKEATYILGINKKGARKPLISLLLEPSKLQ